MNVPIHLLTQTGICKACANPLYSSQKHCSLCGKARQSQALSPLQIETSYLPASLFRRLLACLLDYLIIGLWFLIFNKIFYQQKFIIWIEYIPQDDLFLLLMPYLFVSILYFVIFHSLCGTSPGKWVYGMTFTSRSSFLIFWRFLLRESCFAWLMMFFALPLLLIFFSKEKRGIHDWLSGVNLKMIDDAH